MPDPSDLLRSNDRPSAKSATVGPPLTVNVPRRPLSRFEPLIGPERFAELTRVATTASRILEGRTIWNVSSTAAGGGVAEMLQVLVGYTLDAGVDIRWLVISGDAQFFAITKRIHNRLHGAPGDGGDLGPAEHEHYRRTTSAGASGVSGHLERGDVVLLHDPQTLGMASQLADAGAIVVWRCHVGRETTNQWTDEAWSFLRAYMDACSAHVFSLAQYIPAWLDRSKVWVIPPSIDPFSPKNDLMGTDSVRSVLRRIGVLGDDAAQSPVPFTRRDGSRGFVERRASVLSSGPLPSQDARWVVQVSRWDRLKDMEGVMRGFAEYVAGRDGPDVRLALGGPSAAEVADDPEGAEVYARCVSCWEELPHEQRTQVSLVSLPMDDVDENAAMVNALQRHADVVVQKSLVEGFGLTVAEAMWKGKAVVASAVGGIAQQIVPGTGLLLDDPSDLEVFGRTLLDLLSSPGRISRLGERARRHVYDNFVGDKHLIRYAQLIEALFSGRGSPMGPASS